MFANSFLAFSLLAASVLAAPSSLLPRANRPAKQEGKCEAHIFVDAGGNWISGYDHHWTADIKDTSGNQIGYWKSGENPSEEQRNINTSKGIVFSVRGQTADRVSGEEGDVLTLSYDTQQWNSQDCYSYTFVSGSRHESGKDQHNWWCQFDC